MTLEPYPEFEGLNPADIVKLYELPVAQAREHFNWFKSVYSHRLDVLLEYFYEHLTGDYEEDLSRVGQRVAALMPLERYSHMQEKGCLAYIHEGKECRFPPRRLLTLEGALIAVDMGCLLASCILSLSKDVKWHMPTRPKRYVDLHQPTLLVPGDKIPFNPISYSIGCSSRIANSELGSNIWSDRYIIYFNNVNSLGSS
jgi:hypothetical protein